MFIALMLIDEAYILCKYSGFLTQGKDIVSLNTKYECDRVFKFEPLHVFEYLNL